jgi:hypothetical protein
VDVQLLWDRKILEINKDALNESFDSTSVKVSGLKTPAASCRDLQCSRFD